MKKRFAEEQIIGFLGESEAGLPITSGAVSTAFRRPVTNPGAASLAG